MNLFSRRPGFRRVRLRTEAGNEKDNFVQVSLTEHFDYLDVLSLELAQRDLYQLRHADYGVVAGRVIANEGVGVPNCRVSLFIAAADGTSPADQLLAQRYPWTAVSDLDADGLRYNLLPSQQGFRGFNGFEPNELGIGATPVTPLGSFPERESVLADPVAQAVHARYYRYTTVTNESGDYALVGIPVGSYTLHLDADLTDLGRWSYSPAMLKQLLGYPDAQFEEDGKRIRPSTDLDSLSHLINLNATISVRPLWGQLELVTDTLGITRQDFKLPVPLRPHFTLGGSLFSMGRNHWWGDSIKFRLHFGLRNFCLAIPGDGFCLAKTGCSFAVSFCMGLNIDLGFHTFRASIGCNGYDTPDDTFYFCLGVRIPNIIPFFRFEFRDDYCRLNGGKYDSSPFDIINHGATCECDVNKALEHVPDQGLSSALLLTAQRPELAKLRLFSLTPEISDEQAARWLLPLDQGATRVTDVDFSSFNPASSVKRVPKTEYLEINEDGQFILQPYCNRRPMITREDGRLVDSPDPSKGVMTEFRGYLYVQGTHELDPPATVDASARVALKVPQSFDYAYDFDGDGNPYDVPEGGRVAEWIFHHGLFRAGGLYSVAQRIATRRALLSAEDEALNDTDLERKDPDGSIYKRGWEIQTGLLLGVDSPEGLLDRFPANHITHLGLDSEYARFNTSPVLTTAPTGSGGITKATPTISNFDLTHYLPGGLNDGIAVLGINESTIWTQGIPVYIYWQPGRDPIPNQKVRILFILVGETNPQSDLYLLFGDNQSKALVVDTVLMNPVDPTLYTWTPIVINRPAGAPVDKVYSLRCRILISYADNANLFGITFPFTYLINP
jgi:hypothetical protein